LQVGDKRREKDQIQQQRNPTVQKVWVSCEALGLLDTLRAPIQRNKKGDHD
jgi:hypothetical protein